MKYTLLFIGALLMASLHGFAQDCSKNHPLFNFDHRGRAVRISRLGSSPEFPILRNLSTPKQVLTAMKNMHTNSRGRRELNRMLMEIGFDNGIKDVRLSSIRATYIPSGTTGNMGDGRYHTTYARLTGRHSFKAWKISSASGCYMYLMNKCGNAFAVNDRNTKNNTACKEMPINITSEPKVITDDSTVTKRIAEKKVYIYYHKKGRHKNEAAAYTADIPDSNPSRPLLLRSVKKAEFVPQEYTVTVSTPENSVEVCRNQPVAVAADINVEHSTEYTGNYPNSTNKIYKQVSRRVYKKSMRKMCKARRKENKITELTDVRVNR